MVVLLGSFYELLLELLVQGLLIHARPLLAKLLDLLFGLELR